jgi:hypothetical protein
MEPEKTNHEIYRDELLNDPDLKAKYDKEMEKFKLELLLEKLRSQVIADRSKKTLIGQINKIVKTLNQIYM